jgi:hypothetical protein
VTCTRAKGRSLLSWTISTSADRSRADASFALAKQASKEALCRAQLRSARPAATARLRLARCASRRATGSPPAALATARPRIVLVGYGKSQCYEPHPEGVSAPSSGRLPLPAWLRASTRLSCSRPRATSGRSPTEPVASRLPPRCGCRCFGPPRARWACSGRLMVGTHRRAAWHRQGIGVSCCCRPHTRRPRCTRA